MMDARSPQSSKPSGWEIDWSRRRRIGSREEVWARNPESFQARAREWHWTTHAAITKRGIPWVPRSQRSGRHRNTSGYIVIGLRQMTTEDIALADRCGLWQGGGRGGRVRKSVLEHRLVAARKYGSLTPQLVVRHRNGVKTDNRPENLLLGSKADNQIDHGAVLLELMVWRERALRAEGIDIVEALSAS